MKYSKTIAVLISIAMFAVSSVAWCNLTVQFLNELDGFGGLKWWDSINTVDDLEYIRNARDFDGLKVYIRKKDSGWYQQVRLEKVEYLFKNNQFVGILLKCEKYEVLRNVFFQNHGEGFKRSDRPEAWLWLGKKSTMRLKKNSDDSGTALLIPLEMMQYFSHNLPMSK